MSVLTLISGLSWSEAIKRAGFDDEAAVVGDIAQYCDFLDECPVFPANQGLYNKQLQASRLGTGAWGKAYGATTSISSGTEEITEPVKMYEGDSEIDDRVLKGVDPYQTRDSEDKLNLRGLTQDFLSQLVYVSQGDYPDAPRGLYARRGALSTVKPYLVWGGAGTGSDLTSVLLFEFGMGGFYLVHPGDTGAAGFVNEDRGLNKLPVPVGSGTFWAWVRHYEMWCGMVIRDQRAFQRYANIETAGSSNTFSADTFIQMKRTLPSSGKSAVAFANRTIMGQLDVAAYNKTNIAFSLREIEGYGPITHCAGVPFRMWEQLLDTESAIT